MAQQKKALAYAFAEYLSHELADANEDMKESLEVAIQCLESAYAFELSDEEAQAEFSIAPYTLLEVFQRGLCNESRSAGIDTENIGSEPSPSDKERAEVLKTEGNEAVRKGQYQEAVRLYSEALVIDSRNPIYYVNRAAAYTKLNRLDEAIHDCERGIALDSTYSKAYSRLGTCYFSQRRYDEAVDAYKKAAELDPDNTMYAQNLKTAEKKRGKVQKSEFAPSTADSPSDKSGRSDSPSRGFPSGFGGLGGGSMDSDPGMPAGLGGLGALLNNPSIMGMASQMMQNPAFQNIAQNIMSNTGGNMPNFSDLARDPNIRNLASQLGSNMGGAGYQPSMSETGGSQQPNAEDDMNASPPNRDNPEGAE